MADSGTVGKGSACPATRVRRCGGLQPVPTRENFHGRTYMVGEELSGQWSDSVTHPILDHEYAAVAK